MARLLHEAELPRGRELVDIYLASGATLASQHALWLLPGNVDVEAVPIPVATDPVGLIRAAETLLGRLPDGPTRYCQACRV